jgi:hypothetical protein
MEVEEAQMAPSIHHDTLEKKVQSFDLVQAVMVLNAEWLHDKEGNENGNGTTLHSRGSTSSNSSNSAITMGVFNTDGRHQSKGNNRKSLATSMMSPGKRSTQQQFGSRANSKPQDKMARTTLGAIKVYLTATPTAPHLLLDKQVHADKDNDQFLRFSALSTQIHSMEKITAAINAMLPKASVIMASQDKKNKHGTTTTTQPPQFSSSGFKRRNSGTLVDNSDDHLSKNNELSVQDLINYQLRAVVLTNPLGMPLTFSISSTDPFRVLGSKCLAPPHPLNKGMMASALAANGNGGNLSFPGGIFTLPPQEAVTLYLAYLPSVANQGITSASGPLSGASTPLRKVMNNKNDLSRSISGNVTHDSNNSSAIVSSSNFNNDLTTRLGGAAAAAGGGGGGVGNSNNNSNSNVGELNLKNESEGTLAIHFSTGQVQRMKLVGVVSRPMVVCAPAEYDFGLVHTESSSEFLLFLSNPTKVDAKWNVVHVPVSTPKYNITLDDDLKSSVTDNPNVFSFGQLSGVQQGPCYPLVAAGSSLPLDFNQRTKPGFQQQNLNSTAIAWNEHTTLLDRLKYRNNKNYKEPLPIKVVFRPFANQSYQSRYRFIVENGEGFDVVFSGKGTYEENTLQNRAPKVGPRMYDGF